MYSHETNLII